jgi:hypothetical protein
MNTDEKLGLLLAGILPKLVKPRVLGFPEVKRSVRREFGVLVEDTEY